MQVELAPLKEQLEPLREKLAQLSKQFNPELPVRPAPHIDVPDEKDWLFDSRRDYLDQLAFYKARKNGSSGQSDE